MDDQRIDGSSPFPVGADGLHPFPAFLAREAAQLALERQRRLEAEASVLLLAGVDWDDLVVVTSPLIPAGRVMTCTQRDEHARLLREGVARWVVDL